MTEKRQTSQGHIIGILQHFATKLRNITNFVMLFEPFCPGLSRSKFHSQGERSITHYQNLKQISWKESISYSAVSLWNSLPKAAKVKDVSIWQLKQFSRSDYNE
jgi:hypothetical protein